MKKLTLIILLLSLAVWIGCGSDDGEEPPNGPTGPPRLIAKLSETAPSMTDPDDALWDLATPLTVPISGIAFPSPPNLRGREEVALGTASEVTVRAIYHQGVKDLYMKVTWEDPDHSVWVERWQVDSMPGGEPAFSRDTITESNEDQMMLFFAALGDTIWDAWYWRALTTGTVYQGGTKVTGLAEGNRFISDHLEVDTNQSAGLIIVHDNGRQLGTFRLPSYTHRDTSEFNGYMLYMVDAVSTPQDLPGGWTVGQFVPGRRIDSTVTDQTKAAARGSKWDIWAVSEWSQGGPWSVVLRRPLNTGFSDDLNMDLLDSVRVRIGISNNYGIQFESGSTDQGFTGEFWLKL
jgi:hypothetical protein